MSRCQLSRRYFRHRKYGCDAGDLPTSDYENQSTMREVEKDSMSGGLQENTITLGEDFRSLLNSNCKK